MCLYNLTNSIVENELKKWRYVRARGEKSVYLLEYQIYRKQKVDKLSYLRIFVQREA